MDGFYCLVGARQKYFWWLIVAPGPLFGWPNLIMAPGGHYLGGATIRSNTVCKRTRQSLAISPVPVYQVQIDLIIRLLTRWPVFPDRYLRSCGSIMKRYKDKKQLLNHGANVTLWFWLVFCVVRLCVHVNQMYKVTQNACGLSLNVKYILSVNRVNTFFFSICLPCFC